MPGPGYYLIGDEEKKEVMDVLESGYVSRYGDLDDPNFKHKVYTLEKEFAAHCGTKHALATSSGTSALYIPLMSLDLDPGDEVLVPAFTFVATFSAVIFAGLVPVLVEVDESLNMDPTDIERKITARTKVIIPVHMMGNPADLDQIMPIVKKHNLTLIEDCCQAVGGDYKGKKLGTFGEFGAFSLNVYKTITSGDGGLIVTNDDDLYEAAFGVHDQGHKPMRSGIEVGTRNILGQNYRINELTGAMALAQMRKLDYIVSTLREKKRYFKELISGLDGISFRKINDEAGECAVMLTVQFDTVERARQVADNLGIEPESESGWHVYYHMEHILNYFKEIGRPMKKGSMPQTDDILARSLSMSVGTVGGLGSFGINILSEKSEIEEKAAQFIKACK